MAKKHHKKPKGGRATSASNSAILRYLATKFDPFKYNLSILEKNTVSIGWAKGKKHEKERSSPKIIKSGPNKGKLSNVRLDKNFIGPLRPAPSLAQIAKTLCYGLEEGTTSNGHHYPKIPARNFVEVMKRKHSKLIIREIKNQLMTGANLETLGVIAKGQLQRAILDSNEYEENSPATIRAKGSARPLVDTKTLVNSVDFEIKPNL